MEVILRNPSNYFVNRISDSEMEELYETCDQAKSIFDKIRSDDLLIVDCDEENICTTIA